MTAPCGFCTSLFSLLARFVDEQIVSAACVTFIAMNCGLQLVYLFFIVECRSFHLRHAADIPPSPVISQSVFLLFLEQDAVTVTV